MLGHWSSDTIYDCRPNPPYLMGWRGRAPLRYELKLLGRPCGAGSVNEEISSATHLSLRPDAGGGSCCTHPGGQDQGLQSAQEAAPVHGGGRGGAFARGRERRRLCTGEGDSGACAWGRETAAPVHGGGRQRRWGPWERGGGP